MYRIETLRCRRPHVASIRHLSKWRTPTPTSRNHWLSMYVTRQIRIAGQYPSSVQVMTLNVREQHARTTIAHMRHHPAAKCLHMELQRKSNGHIRTSWPCRKRSAAVQNKVYRPWKQGRTELKEFGDAMQMSKLSVHVKWGQHEMQNLGNSRSA